MYHVLQTAQDHKFGRLGMLANAIKHGGLSEVDRLRLSTVQSSDGAIWRKYRYEAGKYVTAGDSVYPHTCPTIDEALYHLAGCIGWIRRTAA